MTEMDDAFEIAKNIIVEASQSDSGVETEEDTKIQLITRLLTEALDWSFSDIAAERKNDNGFSDYLMSDGKSPVFVLEAKRKGSLSIKTSEVDKVRYLKIAGPGLKEAMEGIDQAWGYAISSGLQLAVLTDGSSWVFFKTFVRGENFKKKEAIIFPSTDAVLNEFSLFYDLLSKRSVQRKLHNAIFDKVHQRRLLLSQSLVSPIRESEIKLSRKPDLAFDLDRVFSTFFERLTGEDDPDLLIECFVETRESRVADFSLEKMTASVLGNISPVENDVDSELANLIEEAVEVDAGQTVFIVGPTGAGKTTFLSRFFQKTLSDFLRQRCLVVRVNCLDGTGSQETVLRWMTETIIRSIEQSIYEDGAPSWEELHGLYHSEYVRRSKGVDARLYERDKEEFRDKFSQYLDDVVEKDREGYLKRLLSDVVLNRKKLPIILIDNTDEFSIDFKTALFQFAQALRRHVKHCLLIFPVTDTSAWSFSKTDIFGIYDSRSFFLPTPPPREVFRRRIEYLNFRLSEEIDETSRQSYFTSRGIKISIENLSSFARVLENIFVDHDYTSSTLGELCNYNVRRILSLSRRIITSSVFDIEEILNSYITGVQLSPDFIKFMTALIQGDYEIYKTTDSHEIVPVFHTDNEILQSPLILLRILALLDSVRTGSESIEERHISVQSIVDYFDAVGCSEVAVDKAVLFLMKSGLVEPFDSSVRDLTPDQRLAISFSGIAHLRLATHNEVFFEQMALTTGIIDEEIARRIREVYYSNTALSKRKQEIRTMFLDYLAKQDALHMAFPEGLDQYDCQYELLHRLRKFSSDVEVGEAGITSTFGEEFSAGFVKLGVIASVDWFDDEKGFGFVEVDGIDGQVFLHVETLKEAGFDEVSDGDDLLCDVGRNHKGIFVSKVHDIETDPTTVQMESCKVIRLFVKRGYGFVRIGKTSQDAFFHYSLLPHSERDMLEVGVGVEAAIEAEKTGRGLQVKKMTIVGVPSGPQT